MNYDTSTVLRKMQLCVMALVLSAAAVYTDKAHAANCVPMHHNVRLQQQMDRLAQLLKLQPAQQDAWKAFAKAEQGAHTPRPALAENASIVEITADQSDYAAEQAVRMEVISQATRKLWVVLNAEQRTTLERVMQRDLLFGRGWGGPGPMGGPGGPDAPRD